MSEEELSSQDDRTYSENREEVAFCRMCTETWKLDIICVKYGTAVCRTARTVVWEERKRKQVRKLSFPDLLDIYCLPLLGKAAFRWVQRKSILLLCRAQAGSPKATTADVLCVIGRCIYDCIALHTFLLRLFSVRSWRWICVLRLLIKKPSSEGFFKPMHNTLLHLHSITMNIFKWN